ncbi:hypothetical protein C8R44DRAFT_864555 [Mycena epipterygia]|nr:hypothetical protein C8R44DRAFT_864555 [Mycena epipterygia]
MSHHIAPYKLVGSSRTSGGGGQSATFDILHQLGACAPALHSPPTASPPCSPSMHAHTLIRFPTGHPLAAQPAPSHGSVTNSVQMPASRRAIAGRGDRSSQWSLSVLLIPFLVPPPPLSLRLPCLPLIVPPRVPHPLSPCPSSRFPSLPSSLLTFPTPSLFVPPPCSPPASSFSSLFLIPLPPCPAPCSPSLSPFPSLLPLPVLRPLRSSASLSSLRPRLSLSPPSSSLPLPLRVSLVPFPVK